LELPLTNDMVAVQAKLTSLGDEKDEAFRREGPSYDGTNIGSGLALVKAENTDANKLVRTM
jgi:hypothetical protein